MARKKLVYKILPSFLLIAALSLAGMAWFAARDMTQFYYREKSRDLEALASVAAPVANDILSGKKTTEPGDATLTSWCREFARRSGTRVTVIAPPGAVLCDTEEDPTMMDDHSDRPEIVQAQRDGVGTSMRFSYTLERPLMYVAVRLSEFGNRGVVRVAVPVSTMTQALWDLRLRLGSGALLAAALVGIMALLLSRRITSPLTELRNGAARFAHGDFTRPISASEVEEFANLSDEMNRMASQLDDRIRTVINQRNELEAVLSSMAEGVLAFDTDERLMSLNQAAARLLDMDPDRAAGRPILEAVRNPELQEFVAATLQSLSPLERELIVYNGGERFLQAHGTPLHDTGGDRIGALVVLNDVTSIRRLENIRREFVANASHEIRTPITSIKGFVETLQDGAIDDRETALRFLGIIRKHSDRLDAIVQDLLNLSRIEKEAEKGEIYLEEIGLREVVDEAVEALSTAAEEKGIIIKVDCPPELKARMSPSLLVQALINLVDNAVKYSGEKSTVRISCRVADNKRIISIQDEGVGIEKKHLPRLFERFYRVDKARSRTLGGTGLGLAIVKHIVQVHGGDVQVESRPGKGSTFTIVLPC